MKKYINSFGNIVTEAQLSRMIETEAEKYGISEEKLWKWTDYKEIED